MDEFLIQLLVRKILSGDINPRTGLPYSVNDIIKVGYRAEVAQRLEA